MKPNTLQTTLINAIAAALCFIPGPAAAELASDTSFGTDGAARLAPFTGYESVTGLATAPDGAVIAVGGAQIGDQQDLVLMRLGGDGRLDAGFADAGIALLDMAGAYDTATSVAITADGDILVAGYSGLQGLVARYDSQGRLDTSFGDGGVMLVSGPGIDVLEFDDIALDDQGRIYLTGRYTVAEGGEYPDQDFLAVRLAADGSLDGTFGDGGFARVAGTAAESTALVLDDAGRLLLAGDTQTGYLFARLVSDGSTDPGFGFDGVSEVAIDGGPRLSTVVQGPDGRYFAAGIGGEGILALADDGSPDPAFGRSGIADVAGAADVYALFLDAEGRLLAAGGLSPKSGSPDDDFFIARLSTTDGSELDRHTLDVGVYRPDVAHGLTVDGKGRTLLGGFADNGADHDFAFARVAEASQLDTSTSGSSEDSAGSHGSDGDDDDDGGSSSDGTAGSSSGSSSGGSSGGGYQAEASDSGGGGGGGAAGLMFVTLMLIAALRRRDYQ